MDEVFGACSSSAGLGGSGPKDVNRGWGLCQGDKCPSFCLKTCIIEWDLDLVSKSLARHQSAMRDIFILLVYKMHYRTSKQQKRIH